MGICCLCYTFVLLQIGGFSAVQTLALLTGLPLAIIQILLIVSAGKMLKAQSGKIGKTGLRKYFSRE